MLCQRLWFPTLDLLEVWMQNRHQSSVPHIWPALCARCGKPQISPLRFAPVEMTKLGVVADQIFLNPIFIALGGPQAHEHSGRDDKFIAGPETDVQAPRNDFRLHLASVLAFLSVIPEGNLLFPMPEIPEADSLRE